VEPHNELSSQIWLLPPKIPIMVLVNSNADLIGIRIIEKNIFDQKKKPQFFSSCFELQLKIFGKGGGKELSKVLEFDCLIR